MTRTTYAILICLGVLVGALAAAKAQTPGTCVTNTYNINGRITICTTCYNYGTSYTTCT